MKTYQERVRELEQEGLPTSDAQGVADVEVMKGKIMEDTVRESKCEGYKCDGNCEFGCK
jgi:hypothetical protein